MSQLMQIQHWLIGALKDIVDSKEFVEQWKPDERLQFKNVLLQWLCTQHSQQLVLPHRFLMNKLSLLIVTLFESLAMR